MSDSGMVIIGAGEAGARAALALRQHGYDGSISLIGHEPHLPYERPPLSKDLLLSEDPKPQPPLILPTEQLAENRIGFLCGKAVTAIDRAGHEVVLDDGRRIGYQRLLLATGARARHLALPGAESAGVLYLRNLADAYQIRAHFIAGKKLAIIGGGFIGLELAAVASTRGCKVTLIERGQRILSRIVPRSLAGVLLNHHRDAGVDIRFGNDVARVEPVAVVLTDGTRIETDTIMAGVGAIPETGLAECAGLEIENGVKVDERLRTSDPDIFAAGDCCSFPHSLFGGRRLRLEAWRNAVDQAEVAAQNMLGASVAYESVPWFWSDQYELTLQMAGLPDEGEQTVLRDLGDGVVIEFYLKKDGRLVGVAGVGPVAAIAKDVRVGEMLIGRRITPDLVVLANTKVKLKSLL